MQSVDEFTPSTTEPVFGSGLVSQTKSQPSTNNEHSDSEKVIPPTEPVVNGQNDVTLNKVASSENNVTNGSTETVSEHSAVHVNGQSTVEPTKDVEQAVSPSEAVVTEKPTVVEPVVPVAAPEPVSSTSVDTVSSEPSSAMETTTAAAGNTDAPVATESIAAEPKGKSPRGRTKAAVPAPAPAPTRQSARGRKGASSSTTNAEESSAVDSADVTATATLNQKASTSPAKNPAPTEPVSTSDDATTSNAVSSVSESAAEVVAPVTPKKRAAPAPAASSAKKAKGRGSAGNVDSGVGASEGEPVESPPKKARTSVTKKTPEPPSEEYARKLRPRK